MHEDNLEISNSTVTQAVIDIAISNTGRNLSVFQSVYSVSISSQHEYIIFPRFQIRFPPYLRLLLQNPKEVLQHYKE